MSNPYTHPAHIRAALRGLELRPTRGMGQNFLADPHALEQIVAAAALTPNELVVEVGPGLGVLTWELLAQEARVLAVELDKRLAARLRTEFATSALHLVQADVLRVPPAALLEQANHPPDHPYKLVANLPYAITSPVLRHFLEAAHPPQLLVVLVQWEVAQRITAAPGKLSMLAHAIQLYATPEIMARVPARSFVPAPAVDSAVLRLHIRPTPAVDVPDIAGLFRVMKAGFLQPRKKLSNALPGGLAALGERVPRETALAALAAANVAPERRAETLTLPEWAAVYRALRSETAG